MKDGEHAGIRPSLSKPSPPKSAAPTRLGGFDAAGFDRGGGKIKEALWVLVRSLFFLPATPLPSAFRRNLLRVFGAKVGRGVVIRSRVFITFPWRLEVGDDCWIGEEAQLVNLAPIALENDVCLSQQAFLCTGSHDFTRAHFDLVAKPIKVRAHSWVAANTFVGPGVDIGPHTMVAAGSVVTRSAPQATIVAGNPAHVTRHLTL